MADADDEAVDLDGVERTGRQRPTRSCARRSRWRASAPTAARASTTSRCTPSAWPTPPPRSRAARDLLAYAAGAARAAAPIRRIDAMAAAFAGEVAHKLRAQIEAHRTTSASRDDRLNATLGSAELRAAVRAATADAALRAIGRHVMRAARRQQLLDRRRDRGDDARLGAPVRRERGGADRRAHPPPRRPRARRAHQQDGRARLLRHVGARGVRRRRHGQPAR